jgi:hypothetical protein
MERRQWGAVDTGTTTTAEAELDRRAQ